MIWVKSLNKRCFNNTVYCSPLITILSIAVWSFCVGLRVFNSVTQVTLRGFTLRGFVWPSGLPPCFSKEHILMLWLSILVSWLVSILVIFDGGHEATPVQPVMVPLLVGWSIPCQRGRKVLSFIPLDTGGTHPFHYPIVLFGFAYCDPVLWVVAFIIGFTICQHQWAPTLLPPPYVHVPSEVCSHITLPVVFTHPLWMLW